MAYRISKKGETYPLKFTPERALWRDSNVLMQLRGMDGGAPQALNWRVNTLGGDHFDLDAFGITNDPRNTAKMLLWRHERIPVFPDVLRDPDRFDTATNALTRAERQASSLNEALLAAAEILAEGSAPRVRDGFDAQARYWARLEGPYFAFLKTLAATDTLAARTYVLAVWTRTLDDTARTAYDEATASLDTTARHLHARVSGRHRLRPAAAYADALKATPSS